MYFSDDNVNKAFFKKGDTLFADGDKGDALYIVETGAIGIFKIMAGQDVCLATMKPGQLFGEMALIDGSPRMADARAVEDSVVVCLPETRLRKQIDASDPFVRAIVKILVDNLRDVHRIFMKKPRSVKDALKAVRHHLDGVGAFVDKNGDVSLQEKTTSLLKRMGNDLQALSECLEDHKDARDSALGETDLLRKGPPASPEGNQNPAGNDEPARDDGSV